MNDINDVPPSVMRPLRFATASLALFLCLATVWAVYAPLATSLQINGHLVSSGQNYEIQHPYGGKIAQIFVSQHQTVKHGAPLLRLDVSVERSRLTALKQTQRRLLQENAVISAILTGHSHFVQATDTLAGAHHLARAQQAHAQRQQRVQATENLLLQIDQIETKVRFLKQQKHQMSERASRNKTLVVQGLTTRVAAESLEEQILLVSAELAGEQAQLLALRDQAVQSAQQSDLIRLSLREELLATRAANLRQLEELAAQLSSLQDFIQESDVRAPMDGRVTEIFFDADGMYANRGQSLLALAQPLAHPYVALKIPADTVDQLRHGQNGRLMISSLNQRNLAPIEVEIEAISPRAVLAEDGATPSYTGKAKIAQESLETLQASFEGKLILRADMPVQVLIEGRTTTLASYLFSPFLAAFRQAMQD